MICRYAGLQILFWTGIWWINRMARIIGSWNAESYSLNSLILWIQVQDRLFESIWIFNSCKFRFKASFGFRWVSLIDNSNIGKLFGCFRDTVLSHDLFLRLVLYAVWHSLKVRIIIYIVRDTVLSQALKLLSARQMVRLSLLNFISASNTAWYLFKLRVCICAFIHK